MAGARDDRPAPGADEDRRSRLRARWVEHGRAARLKTTRQRELIVDLFLDAEGHLSVEELLARVRQRDARIGHATVYRTLRLLTEAGLAAPRQFGDGQTRFEVADGPEAHHDHLICARCGLILEFENPEIEALQERVARELGFNVVRHKLELYGLCPKAMGVPGGRCPDEERRNLSPSAPKKGA